MGTAACQCNATLRIDGKEFLLVRKVAADLWQLEEVRTKRIHEKTDVELRTLYVEGTLTFVSVSDDKMLPNRENLTAGKPFLNVPGPLLEDAKVRRAYAIAAMSVPATQSAIEQVAKQVWAKIGQPKTIPHWTTVCRWRRRLINANRDIYAVVARDAKKGNRMRRFDTEVVRIVEDNIDAIYLSREKKTCKEVLDKSILDVRRENQLRPPDMQLREPTFRLVGSMIRNLPAFDVCVAREGREIAVRRFRSVKGHRTTQGPLERAEIDHTVMDLMVIDDESGLPLGRPVLTVCIDDYTRCILGINIGFEPPSFLSVARCLKSAFMPKVNLKAQYPTIFNEWLAHGVMRELSMDNGAEFHSASLEAACYALGIEIHYSPRKTPWFKGKVERFQGTLNHEVAHGTPGTTFSSIFDREDYDSVKQAVVRLSALQHIVRKWVVDVYHQRVHRTLKVPPAVMWKNSIHPEEILLPADPDFLDGILGRREQRVLTHKGIEFEGLLYNSPDLTAMRMHLGDKLSVEISIDDGDIGKIVVFSPDKTRMFTAPALAQNYAKGMTAWQHKVCKRHAARAMQRYDTTGWLQAKEDIAEMIRQEFGLKRSRSKSRTRLARYADAGKDAGVAAVPQSAPQPEKAKPVKVKPTESPAELDAPTLLPTQGEVVPVRRFQPVIRERCSNSEQS